MKKKHKTWRAFWAEKRDVRRDGWRHFAEMGGELRTPFHADEIAFLLVLDVFIGIVNE